MRYTLKQKLKFFLAWATRQILGKYQPKIIGITGSVGKTSTKEAVFVVVSQKFRARRSKKNYNNEFGLPLTVIGSGNPEGNPLGWLAVAFKALSLIVFSQKYPQVLVLEMGIDRPNDMDYLLSLARPDIAIVTTVGMSHSQFFSDPSEIENEKGKLVAAVPNKGFVILNADNEAAMRQRSKAQAKVITYGNSSGAEIILKSSSETLFGKFSSHLLVKNGDREIEANISAIGQTHISAVLAAVAVAKAMGIEDSLVQKGLMNYRPAPSRLSIIGGIKHSVIIDDSYNAAPNSMREAFAVLARMPNEHKIAVLGNMLELGAISDSAHEEVGKAAAGLGLDHLITVGESGRIIADSARAAGLDENKILSFDTSDEARKTVQNLLKPASAILVKGSQGVRMEKIVKEIMAEPMRAPELVCRQYGSWLQS